MAFVRFIICCALLLILTLGEGHANDADETALRIMRYSFNSNTSSPDLCLEFNRALSLTLSDQNSMLVRLEDDDRTQTLSPHSLTINTSQLCLPSLQYRHEYHLSVSGVRGINHEKLTEPYNLSFIIPDRRPSLAFATDHEQNGIMRWSDGIPIIRSINVPKTHVELYHIIGSEAMLEAWSKRQQSLLAPTESTYFAHNHGELVWQNDFVFEASPNTAQERKIIFDNVSDNFPPGLYLITANAPSVTIKPSDSGLAPQASQWFLRSNLTLHTAHTSTGYYVFSESYSRPSIVSDTHVSLFDNNHHELAQANTNNQGVAYLPVAEEKINDVVTVMGQSTTGEMAFEDSNDDTLILPLAPTLHTTLMGLSPIYFPGEKIEVRLSAIDIHNIKITLKGSVIQILRPDQTLYAEYAVPDFNGEIEYSFLSPLLNGVWSIQWIDNLGHVLAKDNLRTSNNHDAPRIVLSVDNDKISSNGNISITVKSTSGFNTNPAPYIIGHLNAEWINADNMFSGYDGYHFGRVDIEPTHPIYLGSFITNNQGVAHLSISLHPPQDFSPSSAAVFFVKTDSAFGVESSPSLTVTYRPNDFLVGVFPQANGGHFSENSLARFEVIALNPDGHRQDVNNLTYQIYDEGRNFDWFQNEGNWSYRPMQHLRRLTGKLFSINSNSQNIIEWPVTAGTYRLDISNDEGKILNRYNFSAGWNPIPIKDQHSSNISLHYSPTHWQKGQKMSVQFKLDKSSIVYASVASDHLHQIWHQFYNSGDHEISFVPGPEWGDNFIFQIIANGNSGQIYINTNLENVLNKLDHSNQNAHQLLFPSISAIVPTSLLAGDNITIPITVDSRNLEQQFGEFNYTVSSGSQIKVLERKGTFNLATNDEKKLNINISAKEPGLDKLEIEIITPNGTHLNKSWPLTIIKPLENITNSQDQIIGPKQVIALTEKEKDHNKNVSNYIYIDNSPILNTQKILSNFLKWHVSSTTNLALRLQILNVWRKTIVDGGIASDAAITKNIDDVLIDILRRQNSDGGFSSLLKQDSDFINTTAVIYALNTCTEPAANVALKRAQSWLKHHLDNNWFEENERPARAAAYAALAATGSVDKASLNYFSDTSMDKKLSPVVAAQLAMSFSLINDHDKALSWLKSANFQKDTTSINILPFLADNKFFNQDDLIPSLEMLSHKISTDVFSYENAFLFLITKSTIVGRNDGWRLIVNGVDKSMKGLTVFNRDSKSLTLRNPTNKTLYYSDILSFRQPVQFLDSKLITRHFYRTDGTLLENGSALEKNQTYIVVLEGPWPKGSEDEPIELYENPYPFLIPIGCTLRPETKIDDHLSWIKSINFSTAVNCEKLGAGLIVMATHFDTLPQWKFAYFAKANWAGIFHIEGASSVFDGKDWALENTKISFKVK